MEKVSQDGNERLIKPKAAHALLGVIRSSLHGVTQYLIGFAKNLKLQRGIWIVGILIRMNLLKLR